MQALDLNRTHGHSRAGASPKCGNVHVRCDHKKAGIEKSWSLAGYENSHCGSVLGLMICALIHTSGLYVI